MKFQNITTTKLILSAIDFAGKKETGYYMTGTPVIKFDYAAETKAQQKEVFKSILKKIQCEVNTAILNKIIKDITKNGICIFVQEKKGLKLELLKTYSLQFETTTTKQFLLEL